MDMDAAAWTVLIVGVGVIYEINKLRQTILSEANRLTTVGTDTLWELKGKSQSSDLDRLNDIYDELRDLGRELPEKIAEQILEPPYVITPKGLRPDLQRITELLYEMEIKMPRYEALHHSLDQIDSTLNQIHSKLFILEPLNVQLANIDGKLSDLAHTKEG